MATPNSRQVVEKAIRDGVSYLTRQLDEQLGLLRESPNVSPDKYWLYNDNALAAHTLARLGERQVSTRLSTTLQEYGYRTNGLQEVLWGVEVSWPPRTPRQALLRQIDAREVWIELADGEGSFRDWPEYTNLALLRALNEYNQGDRSRAIGTYEQAVARFDGRGFKDKAFTGEYETYKVAMALYAGLAIQALEDDKGDMLVQALLQKQAATGGFYTHYTPLSSVAGDTNIETTSFALLALDEYRAHSSSY